MFKAYRLGLRMLVLGLGLGAGTSARAEVFFAGTDSGFPAPTGDPAVLPAGAKLQRVFDAGCVLTEGVTAGPDGYVYFSDLTFTALCKGPDGHSLQAGNILRYDPHSGKTVVWRSPSGMSNGLKFDREGNLIAALGADHGGRMLVKTDMQSGRSYILTARYEGRPYNAPNDLSSDEQGRIYFSDPRYYGHEPIEQPGFAVYRLDPDGQVTRILIDGGKSNGVLVSPDQKTLYVVSNDNGWFDISRQDKNLPPPVQGHPVLQAFDLAPDGSVAHRRVLVDYHPDSGPDGLTADSAGNVYAALRAESRPGIAIYSPQGQLRGFIPTGKELPTNVGFGRGEEATVLYVTSGHSLYKIRLAQAGYQLPAAP